MKDWPDQKIRDIAVWHIEKASMDPASWRFTLIGTVHPAVAERVAMQDGELPVVSSFISQESLYLFTTRRIVGVYNRQRYDETATEILHSQFGDFKDYGHEETAVMKLTTRGSREIQLEYETGGASMAPMHCMEFWRLKFPVLDKLRFDPVLQFPPCPRCGKPLRTDEAQQCLHCGADWHGQ